jgi:pyruvate/2-oxoglutarate dehydrogenase complex dihydrolipoamide acyltransferase (E2) component
MEVKIMEKEVVLPELGEDAPDEAEVSFWYVQEGDTIEEGEDMVEMVTDKAAFTVPTSAGGTVQEIVVGEGEMAGVDETIAVIDE